MHAAAVHQGWYELGAEKALDFLIAAERELGRRGCPLPLADAYVAAILLPAELREQVEAGTLRPVAVVGPRPRDGLLECVEGAAGATHVLRLDPQRRSAELLPIVEVEPTPGLAIPAWSRVRTGSDAVPVAWRDEAPAVLRLAVAARALAAAGRVHELAVAHAKVRRQFGRVIGGFGAVQQRVAACHIDLTAGEALIDEAVAAWQREAPDADLAIALAVRFVTDTATSICFGAQHTLGAIGYFEEHEAAWLFRRVHADRLLLVAYGDDGVATALLDDGRGLPALDLGPRAEAFRAEIHEMLDRHRVDGQIDPESLRREMAERGLFAAGWPTSEGGLECSTEEQVVLHEELKYAGGPVDRAMSATLLIGHSLLRHGTPEQKATFLPLLREGKLAFCLGYSEPEAGSDLASLRTRAVRDGDSWIIDGQKTWTTRAHTASHIWLAVRTDPNAPRPHAGITIFLVPMDTPGITLQQHRALSGEISCSVFFDNVRVPDSMRVGEVNGGWRVITDALAAERVVMGGVAATMRRNLDAALAILRRDPSAVDGARRDLLARLAARLQAARVLVVRATRAMETGEARVAGPMAAVLSGELAEELAQAILELLGPTGALAAGAPGAACPPAGPSFEAALRLSPMFVIGGGTNDIQRGIIARSLGLPRE